MIRIVLFVHHYPPDPTGGTERHVEGLAGVLARRGWDVAVVTGTMQPRARLERADAVHAGVRVIRIHRDDFYFERWHRVHHPGVSRLVGEILDELRPDVAHVHHWLRLTSDLAQLARARGVPCVVSLHDYFASCPKITRVLPTGALCREPAAPATCASCLGQEYPQWDEVRASALTLRMAGTAAELQAADRVLLLSHAQRDLLAPVLPGVAMHVQPFTSSLELRASPPPPRGLPLRVATLGRISAEKGQHLLLDAVRGLRGPRAVQVHLFGEVDVPAYERRLRDLADGLDVVWHGRYERETLETTPLHAIVLPSQLFETYGLVLDEARMLGVPVLASATGAYPERVGNGGLTFTPGDAADLRAKLQRCVDDADLVARLRSGVTRPPPFGHLVDYLEDCYRGIRAQRGPARASEAPAGEARTESRLAHEFARADHLERLLAEAQRRRASAGPSRAPAARPDR